MISAESYVYYAAFCVACAVLGAAYLRLQATQRVTITTKEFKGFQNNFLVGYVPLMLVELLYLAFFFYVMMYHGLSLEATGKLFIGNCSGQRFALSALWVYGRAPAPAR